MVPSPASPAGLHGAAVHIVANQAQGGGGCQIKVRSGILGGIRGGGGGPAESYSTCVAL